MRSETRLGDSGGCAWSPSDSSLSFNLLGERRWRAPLSGVRGRGPSGPVTERTGMGVSRFANATDSSSAMMG